MSLMKINIFHRGGESEQLTNLAVIISCEILSLEFLKVKGDHLCKAIRLILTRYWTAWSGNLGEITHTVHRIELIPNARPFRQILYRR